VKIVAWVIEPLVAVIVTLNPPPGVSAVAETVRGKEVFM